MIIEAGRIHAPEIGRTWLNSPPLNLRELQGKVVLIDFWDYSCLNCIRTLPYLQGWQRKYAALGLTMIGVHTPKFTFAQEVSNVENAAQRFELTYPIVIDNDYELWKAFANRYWPAQYLIDKDSFVRFAHFGEGGYAEIENQLRALLLEKNPSRSLPRKTETLRESDAPGAVCFRATPEIHLGFRHGEIGNEAGFAKRGTTNYEFKGQPREGAFYLRGKWSSAAEHAELVGNKGSIVLKYSAVAVSAVLSSVDARQVDLEIYHDGARLTSAVAGGDVQKSGGATTLSVRSPRMYSIVDNGRFTTHTLELRSHSPGLRAYTFAFTTCVDPAAGKAAGLGH